MIVSPGLYGVPLPSSAVFQPLKRNDLKRMPKEDRKKMNAIIDWYKDLRSEKTKEVYDQAKLDEVSEKILAELKELTGPTEEEVEAEVKANDEDVRQAEDIDMDNFFGDDDEDNEQPEEQ